MSAIGLHRTAPTGQLTIRASIFLGFVLMCVFTAALEYSAAKMIARSATLVTETFDRSLASIDYARAVAADFSAMQSGFLRLRLATGSDRQKQRETELGLLARTLYADLDISETRSQSVQARRAAETVRNTVDLWQRNGNDLDPQLPLQEVLASLDADAGAVFRQVDQLVSLTASDGVLYRQQALQSVQGETERDFGLMVAALLLSAAVTWMMARRISGPVSVASTIAARIAGGDLDVVIPLGRRDELGDLLRCMATMRDSIRGMMQEEVAQRRSAQGRLMDAIENSQEGVLLVDPSGRIVVANAPLAGFFGDLHEHLAPGAALSKLVNVLARTKLLDESRQTIEALPGSPGGEAPGTVEVGLLNGRWLRINWCPTREGGLIAFFSDITLSRIRVAQLKQSNLWLDAALTNMSQGLCLYDSDARLKVANARFREIYRLGAEEIPPGTTLDTVLSILDAVILDTASGASVGVAEREAIRRQIATRTPFARQHELLDGRVIAFSHRPIADGGWVLTYEDVTERHRSEARISHMARHDKLTDLPNRALLGERLAEAVAALDHAGGCSLLIVDLDRFKAVNDTYGHPIGDAVLRVVAHRLLACSHDRDTVARLGGDEFAIVASGLGSARDAEQFAGRIVRTLAEPFAIEGYRLEIGASVGVAVATQTGSEADFLMRDADMALCSAKKAGRGSYALFTPDMAMELQARRCLETDLLQSLADGQMELAYQPIVALGSGEVKGFEALLRWNRPERGRIMPDDFIWLSEEIGFIDRLGAWILRQACQDAAGWPAEMKVAINVSPAQFRSGQLVRHLQEALAEAAIPPSRVELEITETTLLQENEATLAALRALHALGVSIVLDDFGTGFASLSYLRSFPFDRIKIDRSFVKDFGLRDDADAIVRAIVGLGRSLRIPVTAEGVETFEQFKLVRAEGCDEAQGHLISRPIAAADVPHVMSLLAAGNLADGGENGTDDDGQTSPQR